MFTIKKSDELPANGSVMSPVYIVESCLQASYPTPPPPLPPPPIPVVHIPPGASILKRISKARGDIPSDLILPVGLDESSARQTVTYGALELTALFFDHI